MKHLQNIGLALSTFIFACSGLAQRSSGVTQTSVPTSNAIYTTFGAQSVNMTNLLGIKKDNLDMSKIEGSPYLNDQFKTGSIVTTQGLVVDSVPLRFDLFNNEIEVIKNGEQLILTNAKYAMYQDDDLDTTTRKILATGFPAINGHTAETIYIILGGGNKVSLLKHVTQRLHTRKALGYADVDEIISDTKYYLFSKESGIKEISLSEKTFIAQLPQQQGIIKDLETKLALNLKKENDAAKLVNELDKL